MKLIIDIPRKVVTAIQNGEDYRYDIHTVIAQGVPYEERPHGKWEEDWQEDLDFMSRKGWRCPFCKWRTTYGMPNFCMNCGADMRGESHD